MKRHIFKLTLFLLAGAIINVAVAWALAANAEAGDWTFYTPYSTDTVLADNRFGWPVRSMINDPAPQVTAPRRNVIDVGGKKLPALPIWPGFAINTIFYAAVLWVLVAAPGAIRRRIRTKRGQCASCGYSLRGTPDIEKCPECGINR